MVDVRPAAVDDKPYILRVLTESWGSTVVAAHSMVYDAATLPGFVAVVDGEPAGLLTYHSDGTDWEVVTINATVSGAAARARARTAAHLAPGHGTGRSGRTVGAS